MGSFLRPNGQRKLHFFWDKEIVPISIWPFVTNSESLSKLTDDTIEFGTSIGDIGKISIFGNQQETLWNLETIECRNLSLIKMIVIGNPWHHRPDLVDSTIGFGFDGRFSITLEGFDISHHSDSTFLFASHWGWSRMANIITQFGGNPENELAGSQSISAWISMKASPDEIRSMILKPEQAVRWLADEVDIDPRLSGKISLRWVRSYMTFALSGNITCFETDKIEMTIKDNPLSKGKDLTMAFDIAQSGDESRLTITIDGLTAEPWASFASLYLCDVAQVALAGLALLYSGNK